MAVPPVLSWWQRVLVNRGLRSPDEIPPPDGSATWQIWFAKEGYTVGTDYLPLGPTDVLPSEGRRLNVVWTRLGEDIATIDLHFVHSDGSDTVPFTDDDSETIEGFFDSLWDGLKASYTEDVALDRYVWHEIGVGVRKPNPQKRTIVKAPAIAGTSDGDSQLPEQVAVSITFKTDRRRSWGRVYLPSPVTQVLDPTGYITDDATDNFRTMFGQLADDALAADLPLVVWCPRHNGELLKFGKKKVDPDDDLPDTTSVARSVSQVQVDNIFDVIRSRRQSKATHFATHTL